MMFMSPQSVSGSESLENSESFELGELQSF